MKKFLRWVVDLNLGMTNKWVNGDKLLPAWKIGGLTWSSPWRTPE